MKERVSKFIPLQELGGVLDFPALFRQRFATIPTRSDSSRSEYFSLGIERIKRDPPVVIHKMVGPNKEPRLHLWVAQDSDNVGDFDYVHDRVDKTLDDYLVGVNLITNKERSPIRKSTIIQDQRDRLYLAVDGGTSMWSVGKGLKDEPKLWETFCEEYGIDKIIFSIDETVSEVTDRGWRSISGIVETVAFDYTGKKREAAHLTQIAQQFGMTNSQYLRFSALTRAYFEAGTPIVYEDLARQIVSEK